MSRLRLVYTASANHQAHLLHSLLSEHGIKSIVIDPDRIGGSEIPNQSAQVFVNEPDETVARGIAQIFERNVVKHRSAPSAYDDEPYEAEYADAEVLTTWPTCPRCERPRNTRCPACRNIANDFPLGHMPTEIVERVPNEFLLLCDVCDEAFSPEYYDRCIKCDHEFGSGIPTPRKPPRKINWQKLFGLGMIATFAIGLYLLMLRRL